VRKRGARRAIQCASAAKWKGPSGRRHGDSSPDRESGVEIQSFNGRFRNRLGQQLTRITIKFTTKELDLLSSLASDQLFRREFIDPRLPGYKVDPVELSIGKKLVERLRLLAGKPPRIPSPARNGVKIAKAS